jgi:hypothetical protein
VRFFRPQLPSQNVTRRVGANGTYYIIQEEDGLDTKQNDVHVQVANCYSESDIIHRFLFIQVRVIHKIAGEWSKGISLGEYIHIKKIQ